MEEYRSSLRRVGIALIIVGVVDIGWMIWCITHQRSYSSSFNIFAVIAGVLLVRGSLRTANVVAFFSAFMLSGFIGLLLIFPFLFPFGLLLTHFRIAPVYFILSLLFVFGSLIFLGWTYRQLTAPYILAAIAKQYPHYTSLWRRPHTGFYVGVVLVAVMAAVSGVTMRGAAVQHAISEAKQKVGGSYKFWVSSWNESSSGGRTHYSAVVTAYTRNQIKDISVEWDQ